jgi:hypothetical protein
MDLDLFVKSKMPIKGNGQYEYFQYGKAKVCNYINRIYLDQDYFEYSIEYKYIYSPLRTFFGQSKNINGEIFICSCMRKSIINFLKIKHEYGNYFHSRSSTPLDVEFFPLELAKKSIFHFENPIEAIEFKEGICPRCLGVVIGPKIPLFELYVNQYIYSQGISFFHYKYIDECAQEFKKIIDEFNIQSEHWNNILIVEGKRTFDIYNTFNDDEKEKLYQNNKARYHFQKMFENDIRKSLGFKGIGESLVSETTLFKILEKRFSKYTCYKHYRPPILEGLELDFYICEIKTGFEYQGRQHFEPITHFGGQEKYEKQQENDVKKKQLCDKNGIKIIYINYYDILEERKINEIIDSNI